MRVKSERRAALLAGQEIALLDVREEDPFARSHPLFAANLPLGRVELDAWRRIPRRDTAIVLYDNGEGLALRAFEKLQAKMKELARGTGMLAKV